MDHHKKRPFRGSLGLIVKNELQMINVSKKITICGNLESNK